MSYRSRVNAQANVTIIALLRYQQAVGSYPETLDQLVADDGGQVAWDGETGVRKKWANEGDWVFWPVDQNRN